MEQVESLKAEELNVERRRGSGSSSGELRQHAEKPLLSRCEEDARLKVLQALAQSEVMPTAI